MKCLRRTIFGDVTNTVCYHLAYDSTRERFESLDDEELKTQVEYYNFKFKLDFWLSKYLPSFFGSASMNALVDLAEERGIEMGGK